MRVKKAMTIMAAITLTVALAEAKGGGGGNAQKALPVAVNPAPTTEPTEQKLQLQERLRQKKQLQQKLQTGGGTGECVVATPAAK